MKFDELTPEQIEVLVRSTGAFVVTVTLLNKARKAAKSGDYAKAGYYAVLWAGVSNNYNHANLTTLLTKGRNALDVFGD